MFDNGIVVVTTVAATAIIFLILCFGKKKNGTKNAVGRYPPVASALSLLCAILRGGVGVIPERFMRTGQKLGPVISYNFGGKVGKKTRYPIKERLSDEYSPY